MKPLQPGCGEAAWTPTETFHPEILSVFASPSWPGSVRELKPLQSTLYLKIKKFALEPNVQEARPKAR